ncbi:SCO family protein [Frankia sp. AiPs1]|uniref:SCO family protein n=1 Tax=Frankia sp. AiPs1 TaxID=573493 RepID=UPI0020439C91|nr:SCO family protein [Frankia sp. AiPs1]MCM3926299.1 SCO family protein [Frankia sp. AiPs1]
MPDGVPLRVNLRVTPRAGLPTEIVGSPSRAGGDDRASRTVTGQPAPHRRRWLRGASPLAVAVLAAAVAVGGCSASSATSSGAPVIVGAAATAGPGVRGTALGAPIDLPDLHLTDTTGHPYDLRAHAPGRVTLLFFGYTHCPDICPTTMADLAAALTQVSPDIRRRTSVVFVTSDPQRDTPPVMRHWLDSFDSGFVGLTGELATIDAAARSVGVPLEPPRHQADGSWIVDHGAQVLAFGPDRRARVVYTAGTSVADYAHDLPLLLGSAA